MLIKIAVLALGAICVSAPIIQTARFARFRQGTPWRIPFGPTLEGVGWSLAATSLGILLAEGAFFVGWPRLYSFIPGPAVPDIIRLSGFAIGVFGAWFAFGAQTTMGASWRVGTDPAGERDLVTQGIFNQIRNPIYLGFLLQILGGAILLPTAFSAVVVALGYLGMRMIVASEERFLTTTYGDAYRGYMARTGRFLPRLAPAGRGGKLTT